MVGSSGLQMKKRRGVGVFTCHSRSQAEELAEHILQVPGSRSRTPAVVPQVHWDQLSASAEVCLQHKHRASAEKI